MEIDAEFVRKFVLQKYGKKIDRAEAENIASNVASLSTRISEAQKDIITTSGKASSLKVIRARRRKNRRA